MTQPVVVRLNWEGSETVAAVKPVLRGPCRIELYLAANYHHALYRHFHPAAPPGRIEALDERGGAELLARLAEIEGLAPLAQLQDAVAERKGEVRITGPATVTIDVTSTARRG